MITRYFECKIDGHNKFWEISWVVDNAEYTTRWGPIGSLGTSKRKVLNTIAETVADIEKLVRTKTNKGYKEKKVSHKEGPKAPPRGRDYLEIW